MEVKRTILRYLWHCAKPFVIAGLIGIGVIALIILSLIPRPRDVEQEDDELVKI
jgi:hypothetical protein